jgi:hypothetical protein
MIKYFHDAGKTILDPNLAGLLFRQPCIKNLTKINQRNGGNDNTKLKIQHRHLL